MPNPLHRQQYDVFRELIVSARVSSGLTQVEVAQRLGKPQSYISKCERGERRLDFTEFMELAVVLSIDVPRFVEDYRQRVSA